jgi:AraC-like DNA-binding protein
MQKCFASRGMNGKNASKTGKNAPTALDLIKRTPSMRLSPLCFLLLIAQFAIGQKTKLDSLYDDLEKHPATDTVRLNILFDICYREGYSHPEKCKEFAEQALTISKELHYLKGEGRANRYLATYYRGIGEHGAAVSHAYEMLKAFEQIGWVKGIGQANQLLGIIHEDNHDYEKAKKFYGEAIAIYTKNGLKMDIGYANNSLGSLYISMSKYDSALIYFLKSLEVRKEINDEKGLSQIYGNIAAAYTNLNNYPLALAYFEKALPLVQKLNMQTYLAIQYNNMGKLYTLMGSYEKANYYLLQSVQIAKALGDKRILEDTYEKLTQLEEKQDRFKNALNYFRSKVAYRDSIFTQEKAKQIANVEALYQTEKKDKAIQLLERDKKIQILWRNIFVAAFAFITLLCIGIYFFLNYREKKNQKLLNLQIDNLTTQNIELSAKSKSALPTDYNDERAMESSDQILLRKAIQVVESNIGDTLFGIDKMAEEVGMSRTNLQRKIKAITGFPPSELIRNIRLRKAAVLLKNKSDTVSQIGFLVGFDDPSYFTKSFKKQFGVPPSGYIQSTE